MAMKAQDEVVHLPYYFPNLTTLEQVVQRLYDYITVDGAFVLRNSNSGNGFTVSVVLDKSVKHIKIKGTRGNYYLSNVKFTQLSELIAYYGINDVPNVEKIGHVRLSYPLTEETTSVEEPPKSPVRQPPPVSPVRPAPPGGRPRLPEPLPISPPSPPIVQCTDPYSLMYTQPRSLTSDRTPQLISLLMEAEKCQCGLYIQDARLPKQWAVHLADTTDAYGKQRVFFVSPNQQSSWSLPDDIKALLNSYQREFLRKYNVL